MTIREPRARQRGAGSMLGSERGQEHKHFVAVVAGAKPKGTRPATYLPPAQSTVELFKPHARSCGQVKLL